MRITKLTLALLTLAGLAFLASFVGGPTSRAAGPCRALSPGQTLPESRAAGPSAANLRPHQIAAYDGILCADGLVGLCLVDTYSKQDVS
jgi:hypothetical protein